MLLLRCDGVTGYQETNGSFVVSCPNDAPSVLVADINATYTLDTACNDLCL